MSGEGRRCFRSGATVVAGIPLGHVFPHAGIKLVTTPTATSTLHKVETQVTAVASAFTMANAWTIRTTTTKTPQLTRITRS